jgi:hypothetical protein
MRGERRSNRYRQRSPKKGRRRLAGHHEGGTRKLMPQKSSHGQLIATERRALQ